MAENVSLVTTATLQFTLIPKYDVTQRSNDGVLLSTLTNENTSLQDDVTLATGNATRNTLDDLYFHQTLEVTFLSILLFSIVLGNSIVLLAVGLSRRRHSRMHFFIMHLAISDLSVGLITVLTDLIWKITIKWYVGDAMCKIVKFAQAFVMFASTYMLVALSIDRYDAIARPLSFTTTWTRYKVLVGVAWFLSALFASPMLFLSGVPEGIQECWMTLPEEHHWLIWFLCVMAAVLVIPALIITACYTLILGIIWTNSHLLASTKPKQVYTAEKKCLVPSQDNYTNGHAPRGSPKPNRIRKTNTNMGGRSSRGVIPQAKIRTVKMTFTIVIMFIICWSPYFIFNLLVLLKYVPKTKEMLALSTFVQNLAPLNSAANPIIYGIFSTRICRYLRQLKIFRVVSKFFCCTDPPTQRPPGVSELSNYTDTCDYARRSPRNTTDMFRKSPRLPDRRSNIRLNDLNDSTSSSTITSRRGNNVEMCDLIVITVKQDRNYN